MTRLCRFSIQLGDGDGAQQAASAEDARADGGGDDAQHPGDLGVGQMLQGVQTESGPVRFGHL